MSTINDKAYFEANAGAVIASMCIALVNPIEGDFVTRSGIQEAISVLEDMYADYLKVMDDAYVSINDSVNSFVASTDSQSLLQQIVVETIANLNNQAFTAKQERIVSLDADSNLIVLVNKYIGLDVDDKNLETFRQINNIKNNALFNIEKGTQIKYYV